MIWAAILLCVSGYGWYLIFYFTVSAGYPGLGSGLAGLLFVAVIPTMLGFAINRKMLASNPLAIKVALGNLMLYLLYAVLVVYGSIFIRGGRLFDIPDALGGTAYLLSAFWQLASWLCGMYMGMNSAGLEHDSGSSSIKAVEASLMMIVPSVFLLTFMAFPAPLLLTIILCWFLSFALTLAMEGRRSDAGSEVRYDIVIIHAFIPSVAAVAASFIFFSGSMRNLIMAVQKGLSVLWSYFVKLLDRLSPAVPATDTQTPGPISFMPMHEGGGMVKETPYWLIVPFAALILLFLTLMTVELTRLLKKRLGNGVIPPNRHHSSTGTLLYLWRQMVLLLKGLVKMVLAPFILAKTLCRCLQRGLARAIGRRLPAKTPYHRVVRSYGDFLRWGRKAGFPRKPYETPLEYAGRLRNSTKVPSSIFEDIEHLTSIFMEAYYGAGPVSRQQGEKSEMLFKKIRLHGTHL